MTSEQDDALNREARVAWQANARFWDERIGEGNRYQRELIMPATERLLALQAGETVLDVACGNGNFSRRTAALGARRRAWRNRQRAEGLEVHPAVRVQG